MDKRIIEGREVVALREFATLRLNGDEHMRAALDEWKVMDKRIIEGREVVALRVPRGYDPCQHCLFHTSGGTRCVPVTQADLQRKGLPCGGVIFVDPIDALTFRLTGIYPTYTYQET